MLEAVEMAGITGRAKGIITRPSWCITGNVMLTSLLPIRYMYFIHVCIHIFVEGLDISVNQ